MGSRRRSKTSYAQWDELPVDHLVNATEDFIVFLDAELAVDWKTSKAYDDEDRFPKGWPALQNRYSALEDSVADGASRASVRRAHRLLAEGVARGLSGNVADANAILDEAERFVTARNRELARLSYLRTAGLTMGLASAACLALWLFRATTQPALGATLFWLILYGGAGSMGAFVSVLLKRGEALDPRAERRGHRTEACARVLAGAGGAILLALAVRAGLVYPNLAASPPLLLVVCAFAGISERLVPDLTKRVDAATSPAMVPARAAQTALATATEKATHAPTAAASAPPAAGD